METHEFYETLDGMFRNNQPVSEIEDYLRGTIDHAEKSGHRSIVIAACNELGGLCRVKNDFAQAKQLHKKVLDILEEAGQENTEHYATALLNYADVYTTANEMEEALSLYLESEKLLAELGFGKDYRMAALNNNICRVYSSLGQYEAAEQAVYQALAIIETMPEQWSELATTYVNLGDLKTMEGRYQDAMRSFQKAEDIFLVHGQKDHHYAAALAGAARVAYLMGDKATAEQKYQEAMDLIRERYGENGTWQMLRNNLNQVRNG